MAKANLPTKTLPIELPRIDAGTQSRIAIDEDVVSDYADLIAWHETWPFPPLDVFFDGTDHYVADGFHRYLAAHRSKRGSFPCRIHRGTANDARIFGMTANDQHGLRMTRADKRACVEWLLDSEGKMTQVAIASAAGVSVRTVRTVVADRKYEATPNSPPEVGRQTSATPSGGEEAEPIDVPSEPVDDGPLTCRGCGSTDFFPDGSCRACKWRHPQYVIATSSEPVPEPSEPEVTEQTPDEPDAPESAGTWLRDHMRPVVVECKERFPDVSARVAVGILETLTAEWEVR